MPNEERSVVNEREKILHLYRILAPLYSPIRPFWARTIIPQAEGYLERVVLPETLSTKASVLDMGCGPGTNLNRLLRLNLPFARYVGIDLSPTMLKWRRRQNTSNQGFVMANSMRLPFEACSFDVVLSTWMFSHIPEPTRVIQEAQRLLRPGGWLIVACFTRTGGWTKVLLRRIESLFLMHFVPLEEILSWPGLKEVKTFAGGWNAVAWLRKESFAIVNRAS